MTIQPPSSQQKITTDNVCDNVWYLFFQNLAALVNKNSLSSGTVTNFSFNNINGFTGSVTNSTTTPQLTLSYAPTIISGGTY